MKKLPPPPLHTVTSTTVSTKDAAYYLNRRPQTLRKWACDQKGPMPQPQKINGRLAWSVQAILDLFGEKSPTSNALDDELSSVLT